MFGDKNTAESRFERTFSKTHFYKTFNEQLVEGRQLSETDLDVLLTFLARDRRVVLYDGKTVKVKAPGEQQVAISQEDESIAQLKEVIEYLTHQTTLLDARIDELGATTKLAVVKKNRVAALAALKSKKLAESTLAQRFASLSQLEAIAAKIEQASDNVTLVRVMESSSEALKSLNAAVGGTERVEEVLDHLREQMSQADEVSTILAESSGAVVIDEAEIDDELAALEGEEARKEEAERQKAAAEKKLKEEAEAEETRKRLEAVEKPSTEEPADAAAEEMGRMSLEENRRPEPAS